MTRSFVASLAALAVPLVALVAFGALGPSACSDADDTGTGGGDAGAGGSTCGGIVVEGECVAKCTPDKCVEQNTCTGNVCKLLCDSHLDCALDGSQVCAPAKEDDTDADIFVCTNLSDLPGDTKIPPGIGTECPFGEECAAIGVCPSGERCNLRNCEGKGDCVATDDGGGTCSGDASVVCVPDPCPRAECVSKLTCRSAGQGDADAYCTLLDCTADADCPGGYYCGLRRDFHLICGSDPPKPAGDNAEEPCIDPADFTKDGATYQEGPISLLRNTCIKRTQCVVCESDLDCSQVEAQRCIDIGGEKRCARDCGDDTDCDANYQCADGSCKPRFGSCTGTGQFCEPCLNDLDCGSADNYVYCASASGNERACVDAALAIECESDADCPESPSGRHGECLDEGEQLSPSDPSYHTCYLPYDADANKFGCW